MPEDGDLSDAPSIDNVIRRFTDAELALRETSGAVDRIRSASLQLEEAREDQAAARVAIGETAAAVHELSGHVEGLIGHQRELVEVLRAIDLERLWRHLGQIESAVQERSEGLATDVRTQSERILERLDATERGVRRVLAVAAATLVMSSAAAGLLGALALGAVRIP